MHAVVDLDELEPTRFRAVRQALGVEAFGLNEFELPAGGMGKRHDEVESGQEEVYFVLGGSGVLEADDATIELEPDVYVRVEAAAVRQLRAGPDGLRYLCVGASAGRSYEPPLGAPGLHAPEKAGAVAAEIPATCVRRIRHELGASAFGVNHFELPPHVWHKWHDESATGQEELYLVLAGGGVMAVDDELVELRTGRYVLVQPGSKRQIRAGADGIAFVCFGGRAGSAYEVPW